jgi:serine/threonine protein phosphatase PrpC
LVTCKGMVFIYLFSHSYVFYLEKWKQGDDLIIANLGDSRAVLGRINDQNGIMPVQLTTDLKPGVPGKASFLLK